MIGTEEFTAWTRREMDAGRGQRRLHQPEGAEDTS